MNPFRSQRRVLLLPLSAKYSFSTAEVETADASTVMRVVTARILLLCVLPSVSNLELTARHLTAVPEIEETMNKTDTSYHNGPGARSLRGSRNYSTYPSDLSFSMVFLLSSSDI